MEDFILNRNARLKGPYPLPRLRAAGKMRRTVASRPASLDLRLPGKTRRPEDSGPAQIASAAPFYRLRAPEAPDDGQPVFLTWILHESLPEAGVLPNVEPPIWQSFVTVDRFLDEARTGPLYLRQREIAARVLETIVWCGKGLGQYDLHSYVVMANHVHLLLTPLVDLAKLTELVRGVTARRANELLGQPGAPFWDEERCEHAVRDRYEFERVRQYIERNPVPVGVAREAADFPYSSAAHKAFAQPA
jgi:REP element-mobilizing transposase RayT